MADHGSTTTPDDGATLGRTDWPTALTTGARTLKVVSAVAAGLWILALITVFWNWWDLARASGMTVSWSGGAGGNSSILQALATTLTSTWGYLLVAVVAYTASFLLQVQHLRLRTTPTDA